jgi:hypothetical protein
LISYGEINALFIDLDTVIENETAAAQVPMTGWLSVPNRLQSNAGPPHGVL